ncbi:F-actin-capping protein [Phlyctochytrium planicorne]|nr:F-actin-capping protein [Phlyctochytrium planicorne]
MASEEAKLSIIRDFILDSPPGEINDVFNDVRALLDNDALLQAGVADTFAEYNTEHYLNVTIPGADHQVLLSKYNQLEDGRFLDPRSSQTFAFDHIRQVFLFIHPTAKMLTKPIFRSQFDTEARKYIEDHYPEGISSVFVNGEGDLTLVAVSNKYNANNFWNGRWRSTWTIRVGSKDLTGVLKVNVHYYEDGNVQINTKKDISATLPTASDDPKAFVSAILKEIIKREGDYQIGLNENYGQLSKIAFRSLRRGLPIKGTKMEWHNLQTYKIGSEISKKA